jgi:hypothetical protein
MPASGSRASRTTSTVTACSFWFRRYVLRETGRELADELEQSRAAIRMRLMRQRSSAPALAPRPE